MSLSVTQCPSCESTFNITARILESAGGKVRCGACLTVFEAPENIVEYGDDTHDGEESVFVGSDPGNYFDPSTFLTRQSLQEATLADTGEQSLLDAEAEFFDAVAAETPETEVTEITANVDTSPESPEQNPEHFPEHNTEQRQEHIPDQRSEQDFVSSVQRDEFEHLDGHQHQPPEQPVEEQTEKEAPVSSPSADSSHSSHSSHAPQSPYSPYAHYGAPEQEPTPEAFRLHASFSVRPSPFAPSSPPSSSPSSPPSRQAEPAQPLPEQEESPDSGIEGLASEAGSDEGFLDAVTEGLSESDPDLPEPPLDWTLAAGDEPSEEPDIIEDLGDAEDTAAESTEQALATDRKTPDSEVEQADQSVEAIRARALQAQLRDEEALEALPSENLQILGKFSTPVEILAGKPRSLRRQLTWSAVALLGGVMLGAQYLWQEMDRFSQNDSLRPLYETACQWFDCDLPVYSNIEAIRANNLAVRSHPDVDNALAVNIEFQNSSPFAQEFPVLILSFNAANNSVIALREFSASEYLPEQLRNRRLMPAQTPVQIDLSIIDPGSDAVNYTLAFRRP